MGSDLWVRYALWHVVLVCLDVCLTKYSLHNYLQLYVFTVYIPPLFSYLSIFLYLYDVLMILFRFPAFLKTNDACKINFISETAYSIYASAKSDVLNIWMLSLGRHQASCTNRSHRVELIETEEDLSKLLLSASFSSAFSVRQGTGLPHATM